MTTESISPKVVVRCPLDIVASIPYMLGYQPKESLVAVFFNEESRHILTAGVELVPELNSDSRDRYMLLLAARIAGAFRTAQVQAATSVQVVLYSERPEGELRLYLAWLTDLAADAGMELLASGWVRDGNWFDDGSLASQPQPIDEASETTASWVLQGIHYLPDRQSLRGLFSGEPTELCAAVEAVYHKLDYSWLVSERSSKGRRRVEDELYAYLTADRVEQVTPESFARWLVGIGDRRVREPLLTRLVDYVRTPTRQEEQARRAMDRVAFLVRNAPDLLAASMASVAAAYAWLIGDGALATVAAERGLREDRENVLCSLVWQAVSSGVHPREWAEVLTTLTLRQLRSSQPYATRSSVHPARR